MTRAAAPLLTPPAAPPGDAGRDELTRKILERRMTPDQQLQLLTTLARGPAGRTG